MLIRESQGSSEIIEADSCRLSNDGFRRNAFRVAAHHGGAGRGSGSAIEHLCATLSSVVLVVSVRQQLATTLNRPGPWLTWL